MTKARAARAADRLRVRARATLHRKATVCDDLQAWARSVSGAECRVVLPARRFTRNLPRTVEPEIDEQYVTRQTGEQPEKFLVRIDGARLVGANGLVVLPDGVYAAEAIYGRALLEADEDYYAPRRQPVVEKSGDFFSLLVLWSKDGNYYHWLHDALLRMYGVVELLPPDTSFIVPPDLRPFQRDSLALLGIDESRTVPFSGDEVWQLERLHFSNRTTNSGSDRAECDEWLRDQVLAGCGIEPAAPTRSIFLSRRATGRRMLANEQEVEDLLRARGFETCVPEALSFREQVELFATAKAIVGTHGAGLTNMLFAPPGAAVVDMIPRTKIPSAYVFWAMAEELGHAYWYFVIDDVAGSDNKQASVPIEKLAATLDRLEL